MPRRITSVVVSAAASVAAPAVAGSASAGLIGNGVCTPATDADRSGLKAPGANLSGAVLVRANLDGARLDVHVPQRQVGSVQPRAVRESRA